MIEDSCLRGIVVDYKEKIAKMKTMLVTHEHPNATNMEVKNSFIPKLLTAADWSKDAIANSFVKLEVTRSNRN